VTLEAGDMGHQTVDAWMPSSFTRVGHLLEAWSEKTIRFQFLQKPFYGKGLRGKKD